MISEKQLTTKIDSFIEENKLALVQDLKDVIAVRSVEDMSTAGPGAPFGKGPRKALDVVLNRAKAMGLITGEDEGYVGWAELKGEKEGHIATITHLDVVPEGQGWDSDPYTLVEKEGWLIGRGVVDDKGPSILCLYAAKFLKENGIPLKYGYRALFGCNEETGMEDVEHYLAHHEQPLFCFSPDADFPVCYGEKGVYSGNFVSPVLQGNIVEFSGGIASNVIPDRAYCIVKEDAPDRLKPTDKISLTIEGDCVRLDAKGKGGHAAHPAGTVNAIGLLVEYLLENQMLTKEEIPFVEMLEKLHASSDGCGVGIACRDEIFDPLTCIGGMIRFEGGRLTQNINVRFPTSTTGHRLTEDLTALASSVGAAYKEERSEEPFHVSPDSAPIQALLQTYNEITGKQGKPFTMGGGTYARHFANAASFGPEEPGEKTPDFIGQIHGANEGASLDSMLKALKIYILALCRLQELDY